MLLWEGHYSVNYLCRKYRFGEGFRIKTPPLEDRNYCCFPNARERLPQGGGPRGASDKTVPPRTKQI